MMTTQPILSERDWDLILNLLKTEREELPNEVHHTDNREMAQELASRRALVEDLLGRLKLGLPARVA